MVEAELARVLPGVVAGLAEDRLDPGVVAGRVVGEPRRLPVDDVAPPAGQRARLLAHVRLRVGVAVRAEREELHHLARVVLVRLLLDVLVAVQPDEHRRILGHADQQVLERAERVAAEQVDLVEHQPLRGDARVRGREPVVPDERHPLDHRRVSSAPSGRATRGGRARRRRQARAADSARPSDRGRRAGTARAAS